MRDVTHRAFSSLSLPPTIRRINACLHSKCLGPNIAKKKQNSLLLPFQALTRLSALSFSVPPSVFFFCLAVTPSFSLLLFPTTRVALLSRPYTPPLHVYVSLSPVSQQDRTRQVKRWWARRFSVSSKHGTPKKRGPEARSQAATSSYQRPANPRVGGEVRRMS